MTKHLVLSIEEVGAAPCRITLVSEGGVVVPPEDPEPPPVVIPPAGAGWVVVTSELLWTFKDNRTLAPSLGSGGTYRVEANFDIPGTVLLHGEAHVGPGPVFPMPGNPWWFLPHTARLKPCRRGVGPLRIYHNNKGPLTGGEIAIQYNAGATPPYYYFALIHNPNLGTDGFLDSEYPPNCWSTDGSYWLFDITYRTA